MKKTTTIIQCMMIMLALSLTEFASGQSHKGPVTPVKVGTTTLNLGIGVGANYKGDNYGTAFGTKIAAEWALWEAGPGVVSIGPEIGGSFSSGYNGYYGYNNYGATTWVLAGRAAWHYGWEVPGLDTYAGFSAGVGFHSYHYDYNGNQKYNSTIPVFGGFFGASYYISPTFGFNAEAGFDITLFQVGIVLILQ